MTILNWKTTKADHDLIDGIAHRAKALAKRCGVEYSWRDAMMDVQAVHCNDWKLDLAALSATDDGNFGHDVFGIRRHLNRETGKLEDCFVPRFAAGRRQ